MKTRTLLWFNLSALLVGLGLILHGAPPVPVLLGIGVAGLLIFLRRNKAPGQQAR
ncbi:MAG: hypothetical protein ACLQBJ_05085 [Bryobacteraceae bacterium]